MVGRGADLHARDARGRTPLLVASACNRAAAATALLTAGADAAARDADGLTALDVALKGGGQPLVAALVTGAVPAIPDDPGADVPEEFAQGKLDGKFYLIRLKHGGASWNAYNDGLRRLLGFLNAPDAPWQDIPLLLDAHVLRTVYLDKPNGVPSCLYLYADVRFSLRPDEAALLRTYLARGGFVFVDGPSGPEVRAHVMRELEQVCPEPLAPLPADHPIYQACYALRAPGVGEDLIKRTNYGVTRDGRLALYYTQANFSHLFSRFTPDADDYITAQYQMTANVLAYARAHGRLPDGVRRPGASATITAAVLDLLTRKDEER
jgi:hypothetical protein